MPHSNHCYEPVAYLDVDYGAVSYWSRETNDFDINSEIVITPVCLYKTPLTWKLAEQNNWWPHTPAAKPLLEGEVVKACLTQGA